MGIMVLTRLLVVVLGLTSANPALAFDSFEHSEIGREAFKSALARLDRSRSGLSKKLLAGRHLAAGSEAIGAVANGREFAKFTFGDLVAIYGDYAVNVEQVNSAGFVSRVDNLKRLVRGQGADSAELEYSIHLAVNNPTHFSLRAAQAYTRWHRHALLLAQKKGRLWEALHYEALALHSFTDLFAFGHMHNDRQLTDQIKTWGEKNKTRNILTVGLADAASKTMGAYVNFYHNGFNWKGAMMKNLAGDSWRGFGDKKYRVVDSNCQQTSKIDKRLCSDRATARQRDVIVHAVSLSIHDVLKSATGTKIKVGSEYRAMCHLPVKFWNTAKAIPPENQKGAIVRLRNAMQKQGRPIEKNGFDFSLGILKFEKTEYRGTVKYYNYVKQHCGRV